MSKKLKLAFQSFLPPKLMQKLLYSRLNPSSFQTLATFAPVLRLTEWYSPYENSLYPESRIRCPCVSQENVNFNMLSDTFLGFLKSHASTACSLQLPPTPPLHTHLTQIGYAGIEPANESRASSKRQIPGTVFECSKKLHGTLWR